MLTKKAPQIGSKRTLKDSQDAPDAIAKKTEPNGEVVESETASQVRWWWFKFKRESVTVTNVTTLYSALANFRLGNRKLGGIR
jgi:hypothetical protein